jgi:8-oxo-dGTP pyrophosphatase MutT (NUDIX family)
LTKLKEILAVQNRSPPNEKVEAAVAVMLSEADGVLETLLIQRTERHDDPWSGQIGLPGGRVKASDQSTLAALEREVLEEVGIRLEEEGVRLGPLSLGHPMRRTEMRVQPWVYGLRRKPAVESGPEVTNAFWVAIPDLKPSITTSDVTVRERTWRVESFLLNGRVVWGFTYRVLTELLQIPEVLS